VQATFQLPPSSLEMTVDQDDLSPQLDSSSNLFNDELSYLSCSS